MSDSTANVKRTCAGCGRVVWVPWHWAVWRCPKCPTRNDIPFRQSSTGKRR